MSDIILYASTIRYIFEKIRFDHSLTEKLVEYNKCFTNLVKDKKVEDFEGLSENITLGIAFSLQTFSKDSALFFKQKEKFVKCALKVLSEGIISYTNKRWRAECAFWTIFVLGKNELYVNDMLCDTLVLQDKPVTVENIKILKNYLIEYLFRLTGEVNFEKQTYMPLYNENNNGLNDEIIHQYHYEWGEPGAVICREKGLLGAEFTLSQEKMAFETFVKTIK